MSDQAPSILNVSFYRFVELDDLPGLRARFKELTARLELKGTILLSPEGINGFLAGTQERIAEFMREAQAISPAFAGLDIKESWSPAEQGQPFNRMLVKLKKEIIAFGKPEVKPSRHTGPRLEPEELKRWYDEGREFVIVDTRNDYEIRLGTFENAVDLNLDHFRKFPEKLAEHRAELEGKPVVMFCTGGIRCEKATAWAMEQGMRDVYQLEGGILRYFEKVGGAHYKGDCFVFDQRVAVRADLSPSSVVQCFACRAPVTAAEQRDPAYVYEKSCPRCAARPEVEPSTGA